MKELKKEIMEKELVKDWFTVKQMANAVFLTFHLPIVNAALVALEKENKLISKIENHCKFFRKTA